MKDLFRRGIRLYKQGKDTEAYTTLEKALQQKPDPDLVDFLLYELQPNILINMLASQGKLHETALRIMELAKASVTLFKQSSEEIEKQISKLADPQLGFDEQFLAINTLVNLGPFALPALMDTLGHPSNETLRLNAILTLTKMGDSAVTALVEALQTTQAVQKQNIIIVLGNIGDQRSLADLAHLLETSQNDPSLQRLIREALSRIYSRRGQNINTDLKPSCELYAQLADLYYHTPPLVLHDLQTQHGLWHWNIQTNKLELEETLDFEVKYLMSERNALRALAVKPDYDPAWIYLIRTLLAYHQEARLIYETLQKSPQLKPSETDKDKVEAVVLKSKKREESLYGVKPTLLYKTLALILQDQNPLVAVECLSVIERVGKDTDLPRTASDASYALYEALRSPDKRIRYAAVETILAWNPGHSRFSDRAEVPSPPPPAPGPKDKNDGSSPEKSSFLGLDLIPSLVNEALQEEAPWQVLVVEENPDVRNRLTEKLRALQAHVLSIPDPAEALAYMRSSPLVDMAFIDFELAQKVIYKTYLPESRKVLSEISFFESLKNDWRTQSLPLVILAYDKDAPLAQTLFKESEMVGILKTPLTQENVGFMLKKAIQQAGIESLSKARADETVRGILMNLNKLNPETTLIRYKSMIPTLLRVAQTRMESLRQLAIQVLGTLPVPGAVLPLSNLLTDTNLSKETQLITLHSLQKILNTYRSSLSPEALQPFLILLRSGDADLRQAASEALGNASLSPDEERLVLDTLRK